MEFRFWHPIRDTLVAHETAAPPCREREFFINNLLVRIHVIIVMIRQTGLVPWEFEYPFPGSLTSTFLVRETAAPLALVLSVQGLRLRVQGFGVGV